MWCTAPVFWSSTGTSIGLHLFRSDLSTRARSYGCGSLCIDEVGCHARSHDVVLELLNWLDVPVVLVARYRLPRLKNYGSLQTMLFNCQRWVANVSFFCAYAHRSCLPHFKEGGSEGRSIKVKSKVALWYYGKDSHDAATIERILSKEEFQPFPSLRLVVFRTMSLGSHHSIGCVKICLEGLNHD